MKKLFVILMMLCLLSVSVYADEIDDIISAIIEVESGGNPNAVGKNGETGLMQISKLVLEEYNENGPIQKQKVKRGWIEHRQIIFAEDLLDPRINKIIGEWYLRRIRDHYLKDVSGCLSTDKNMIFIFNGEVLPVVYLGNDYDVKTKEEVQLLLILSAYNCGPAELKSVGYNINKCPKSTQEYVKKVMKLYQASKNE